MKSTRWLVTYIFMASVGLWFAFFVSLKFISKAHSQTPPPPPAAGDLPPEFAKEAQPQPQPPQVQPPPQAQQQPPGGRIPPPPTGTPPPPTQAQPADPAQPTAAAPQNPKATVDQGSVPVAAPPNPEFAQDEDYTYDPGNRRDPFKPYKNFRPGPAAGAVNRADLSDPLQRWDINRFVIMAIIWEVRNPKAMIKDPDGATYIITKNTKIGRNGGYVVAIREGEVVVVETVDNEGIVTKEVRILELKK